MQSESEIDCKDKHVTKFLDKTNSKDLINIYKTFKAIENLGIKHHLRTQDIKKIKGLKVDLYEIRVKTPLEYRFLGSIKGNVFAIVHVFVKKTRKGIKKEIDLAIKRLKNLN